MKQRALALAIRRIVWAELALSAVIAVPAFAQSQPAATGTAAGATTESTPATGTAATPSADGNTATPTGKGVQQLKKFEVTGSLIRTSDKVGNTEVQTITAKDIQQSGYTTVADFLRGTSANSGSSWGQTTMNSSAQGGGGIALRGLSEKYTLVLVDGQRVANYGKAVNFTDTFFDVNSIPLNMIDHIDIVKTGAVSVYGSDAIAGVVNIITKKDFQGLQIDGQLGKAQHPGDAQGNFSVLGGIGDLNGDRFNVTAAASYYRDTGSSLGDRDMTAGQDFSQFPGGLAVRSVRTSSRSGPRPTAPTWRSTPVLRAACRRTARPRVNRIRPAPPRWCRRSRA
ncbi:TonB-dependent receptor-like protein [Paraburkholderia sp. BL9I2N2]|nr:TonB-dependent receptor-like protein [Paraburkholderia sp. BL9I2N2]